MDITQVGQYGVGVVALVLLAYALKLFHDSYQKNTDALRQLTAVMEKQGAREHAYMQQIATLLKDTNERVRKIEDRV